MIAAVVSVNAQIDTLQKVNGKTADTNKKGNNNIQASNDKEDRVAVELIDIPDLLRLTLQQNEKYRGWENSKFYFEESSKTYLLHLSTEAGTRTYYFDENGKRIINSKKAKPRKSPSRQKTTSR
jgi:hypothetical protein